MLALARPPVRPTVRGRQMYLGYAPPAPDPLPDPPRRAVVLLARLPDPGRLTVRVGNVAALRRWVALARPGDVAVYYAGSVPLITARETDPVLAALADEALKQSDAKDVPIRSKCRHIRNRQNGLDRVRLHSETLPWGLGTRCYCVRLTEPHAKANGRAA